MIDLELLSNEERNAIDEIRMRVETALESDLLEDSTLFYRFLKARDFNVDKAEKMLRKHIIWRKSNQISTVLQDFVPREIFTKYPDPSNLGFDKEGDTVHYLPLGKLDAIDVLRGLKMNEYEKHWIWYTERYADTIKQSRKEGKKVHQLSVIIDLDKLTFRNATNRSSSEIFVRTVRIFQDNYPECLKFIYLINAPSYYVFIYTIVKAMLSNALVQKILAFGHDGWKKTLLEAIDADVLPAFLGGNRTDPDGNPLCKTFIKHGGKVPECYYLSNEDRYFKDKTRVTKIVVSDKKEVNIDVKEEGSVIQWKFFVKNKDIGFGVFYKESEEVIEVLPVQKYDTLDGIEVGSYRAKSAGKYAIIFDNSHSWITSKEILYIVEVIPSSQDFEVKMHTDFKAVSLVDG